MTDLPTKPASGLESVADAATPVGTETAEPPPCGWSTGKAEERADGKAAK